MRRKEQGNSLPQVEGSLFRGYKGTGGCRKPNKVKGEHRKGGGGSIPIQYSGGRKKADVLTG